MEAQLLMEWSVRTDSLMKELWMFVKEIREVWNAILKFELVTFKFASRSTNVQQ